MSSKPIQTIAELFLHVAERGEEPCLMQKRAGVFEAISAAEVASRVYQLAAAFDGVGVNRGDRIALLADNGPEWPVIDFAFFSSCL